MLRIDTWAGCEVTAAAPTRPQTSGPRPALGQSQTVRVVPGSTRDILRPDGFVRAVDGFVTEPGSYFRHVGESPASLARLIKECSVDHRCFGRLTAWTPEHRDLNGRRTPGAAYSVLGWTSAALLRSSLSSRLDALNPVAAMRLLDQPEIAQLERTNRDFVVLRGGYGLGNDWPPELGGAISAFDIDLWIGPAAVDLGGAVALDFDNFHRRFSCTQIAA